MKEATGELNMTVITIVAIAAIAAFFYALIWPSIKANMQLTSACNAAGATGYSDNTVECAKSGDNMVCTIKPGQDNAGASKTCD